VVLNRLYDHEDLKGMVYDFSYDDADNIVDNLAEEGKNNPKSSSSNLLNAVLASTHQSNWKSGNHFGAALNVAKQSRATLIALCKHYCFFEYILKIKKKLMEFLDKYGFEKENLVNSPILMYLVSILAKHVYPGIIPNW
jgi:predicted kinase